jgi:hypothetical protein
VEKNNHPAAADATVDHDAHQGLLDDLIRVSAKSRCPVSVKVAASQLMCRCPGVFSVVLLAGGASVAAYLIVL